MHRFCSSLTKFSSTKSLQTRFVTPHKPSIDTFLVIKVIISNDKFIAIYTMKKFGARFSFSDFHGQKFSQQHEPGLKIFSNTYYTKLAFQTSQSVYEMKFSTMILLVPLKVRLKTKRSPFTVC